MTGMKQGAGENPFADDPDEEPHAESNEADEESNSAVESDEDPEASERASMQIPYKFRRDGVQDGRNRVPLFLKPETKASEREALRELEDEFGNNVSLTDLREALVLVGLDHGDEVKAQLEEWGYGMTFE